VRLEKLIGSKDNYNEEVHSTFETYSNPHKNVDVSILILSIDIHKFCRVIISLVRSCRDVSKTEIILKIDNSKDANLYEAILETSNFQYKILTYPCYNKRSSCHHFYNDMAAVASGKIIWLMPEDAEVVHGNWYLEFMKTRDNIFDDNIYYIAIPVKDLPDEAIKGCPAVTREWVDVLGFTSAMPNNDRWLWHIAKEIGREVALKEADLCLCYPPGKRVMSKGGLKHFFDPVVLKAIQKFRDRIKE
tara:strand:+ start:3907 stop:4644 length:738 start_codon:yes stop_codon:yes gene_type:complete